LLSSGRDRADDIVVEAAEHEELSGVFMAGGSDRSACGRLLAAGATMAASRPSDAFAGTQVRDAPHARPGRSLTSTPSAWATGIGRAPIIAGCSTSDKGSSVSFQLPDQLPQLRLAVGRGFVEELFGDRAESDRIVSSLADVPADETSR
jgi:hypothetical protein